MADHKNRYFNSDRTAPSNHEVACNGFDCTRAIELNPDYQNIYQRGWLYVSKGEYDRSIADFTKLVNLYPSAPGGYYGRGWAYAEKCEYDEAITDFTNLIEMNPDSGEAYFNRGEAYADKGEYDRAIADFTRDIVLGDIYCYFVRGLVYAKMDKKSEAIADFDVTVRLSEDPELIPKARQEIERLCN